MKSVAAAVSIVLVGLAGRPAAAAPDKDLASVVDGSLGLAQALYQRLRGGTRNLVFSPVSITAAMALAHGGARGNTASQMARVLGFRLPPARLHPAHGRLLAALRAAEREGVTLSVANALWGQRGHPFLPAYLELAGKTYGGKLEQLDFVKQPQQARQAINSWVSSRTRGKITDIIPPGLFDEMTRLVLTNAVYFNGQWKAKFPRSATRPQPFMLGGNRRVETPLMNVTSSFRYRGTRTFQVLELPYRGGGVSMVVLLPRRVGQLRAVEPYLHPARLRRLLRSMPRRQVEVYLPRFQISSGVALAQKLQAMGMTDAFANRADFSGADGTRLLFLQAVLHKAWVEVNEKGTEAAAATAITLGALEGESEPPRPIFRADRPFLFLIREARTGCVLFLGRLLEPDGPALAPRPSRPLRLD